jgi:hypothetical protein
MLQKSIITALFVLVLSNLIFASVESASLVSIKPSVNLRWDFFMIMNSSNQNPQDFSDSTWLNGVWMQSIKSNLSLKAQIGRHTSFDLGYYAIFLLTTPVNPVNPVQRRVGGGGLEQAYLKYQLDPADSASLALTFGLFPFDYTYSWQHMGGYLYRTGIYPGYILPANFDNYIQGACFSFRMPSIIRHDLLVTIETKKEPINDITLSYIARLNAGGFELALGGMLHRLIRTDQGHYDYQQTRPQFYIDDYPEKDWDTTQQRKSYKLSGIKPVSRFSFDFKSIGKTTRLGQNDLILYGEGAILGITDFPGFYENILERIPVTAGFTFPVFKFLDVAGIELEYYGSPWKNDQSANFPIPVETYIPNVAGNFKYVQDPYREEKGGDKAKTDNLKWAFFLEKTIKNRFFIGLHAASDHFRSPEAKGVGSEELLYSPVQWYWQMTIKTLF